MSAATMLAARPALRRRPYALSHGNYSHDGLGQVTGQDVANIASLAAGLISNPEATLQRQGPRLVAAVDTYLVGPAIRTTIRRYVVPYFGPPLIVLYILSGMSMWASYKVLKDFEAGKVKANGRRRKKRRA